MDQKNTMVKCAKHNCLFNNYGTCDQYVITIGVDNTCQAYTETEGFTFEEQKACHSNCIHFDDSDPMVGPVCLFQHPKPLKAFYDGMPCDFYHQKLYATENEEQIYNKTKEILEKSGVTLISPVCGNCNYFADNGLLQCPCDKHEQYVYRKAPACGDFKAKRGQRIKGNFIEDDWVDPDIVEEVCQPFKVKVAELNKPNKNKSILQSEILAEGINVTAPAPQPGSLSICYWCDYFNSNIKKCYCKNPILTPGECHSCKSTGGNR